MWSLFFASFDLQLPVSSSEKYPHIVHEEHSEEIDDDKCQDCMTECDMDILEGKFIELHAEYFFFLREALLFFSFCFACYQ
jgi:hypothetical protein